ncbi:MAG: hypothetical protein IPK79_07735 [Vampirovibrionales bacterium]|nr:hypothetical protein [Vampirovibrionales bacterium]
MAGVTLFVWCWMLVYGLLVYKPTYQSEGMALIKDSAITNGYIGPDTEQNGAPRTTSSQSANPVLNTMELLKSATIMDALWDFFTQLHPEELRALGVQNKTDWTNFFKDGSDIISAKNKAGTDLISVRVKWTDPYLARDIANVTLSAFQKASLEVNQAEQKSRSDYMEEQLEKLDRQLAVVRREKSAFKQKHNLVDSMREGYEATKMRADFVDRLNQTIARANGKRAELSRYQQTLGMSPTQAVRASAVGMNATLNRLKGDLYNLSETNAFLSSSLTDNNPKVQEVRAKMAQVQQDIRKEMVRTVGTDRNADSMIAMQDPTRGLMVNQMVTAQAEMNRLSQEASALQGRVKVLDNRMKMLPAVEEGLANIEQRERSLSEALDALRRKHTEAQMKEAQTLSNVFIVDRPRLPKKPNFPAPLHQFIISLLLGPLLALMAVIVRNQARRNPAVHAMARSVKNQARSLFSGEAIPVDEAAEERTTLKAFDEAIRARKTRMTERYGPDYSYPYGDAPAEDASAQEQVLRKLEREIEDIRHHLANRQESLGAERAVPRQRLDEREQELYVTLFQYHLDAAELEKKQIEHGVHPELPLEKGVAHAEKKQSLLIHLYQNHLNHAETEKRRMESTLRKTPTKERMARIHRYEDDLATRRDSLENRRDAMLLAAVEARPANGASNGHHRKEKETAVSAASKRGGNGGKQTRRRQP